MRFVSCLLLILFPCSLWATDLFGPGEDSTLDFLYINANIGEAAGGHTALRLGDAVFHYQFFPDETFLLVRDSWGSFRFLYNDLHNRSISIATLPLVEPTQTKIRNHFTELLVGQQQFFDELEQAQKQKKIFARFLEGNYDFEVNGLGFFTPSAKGMESSQLRRQIAADLGDGFLARSVAAAVKAPSRIIESKSDVSPAKPKQKPAKVVTDKTPAPTAKVIKRSATSTKEKSSSNSPSAWVVQIASLTNSQRALELRDKLKKLGFNAFVEETPKDGKKFYRVRVGPELKQSEAEALKQKIMKKIKLEGNVMRYQPL